MSLTSATITVRYALFFTLLALTFPMSGQAQQLIINGDFETGTFASFTLADQFNTSDPSHADHFYISAPGANTPLIGLSTFSTAANAAGGSSYAVSASDNPGAHAFLQNFVVPLNAVSLTLTFQMFVNDQSAFGPIIDPTGLDYTTGGLAQPNDNQHARVDILRMGTSALSTAPADVVDNLYLGVAPSALDSNFNLIPNPYLQYSFDLFSLLTPLTAGETYRLRFAQVDNISPINMGVDNISLFAAPASTTPEPGAIALLAAVSVTGSVFAARRRARTY